MRGAILTLAAWLAWTTAASAQPGPGLDSGCQRGFQACWDFGAYLEADGRWQDAQRHRGLCTDVLNDCRRWATPQAQATFMPPDFALFPRGTAGVRITRNGQSYVVWTRMGR
jgi:hypothetical protein